ncbi:hypothetical protein BACILLUS_003130 [Priestia megaterium]
MENKRQIRIQRKRNFPRAYGQIAKKQLEQSQETDSKKTGVEFLQDTAWLIAVLTGLGYFFSLSYQKGREAFYGIEDISLEDLGLSTVVNSIYDVSSLVLVFCLIYFFSKLIIMVGAFGFSYIEKKEKVMKGLIGNSNKVRNKAKNRVRRHIDKNFTKEKIKGEIVQAFNKKITLELKMIKPINLWVNFTFISVVISIMPYIILGDSYTFKEIVVTFFIVFVSLCMLLFISFFLFILLMGTSPTLNDIYIILIGLAYSKNPLNLFWRVCKLNTKVIVLLTLGLGMSFIFYQYGYTQAEKKEDYTLIEYKKREFVLVNKNDKQFLVTPLVRKGNKFTITKTDYQLIEVKKDMNTPFLFKSIKIKEGLQVLPNERKEMLNKFDKFFES